MDKKTELAIDLGQTIYNNTIRDLQGRIDAQYTAIAALLACVNEIVSRADYHESDLSYIDHCYEKYNIKKIQEEFENMVQQ